MGIKREIADKEKRETERNRDKAKIERERYRQHGIVANMSTVKRKECSV